MNAGAGSIYISIWDTVVYAPNNDFEGDTRPQRNFGDMGADEYSFNYIEYINQKPEKFNVSVYPNPFNSSLKIGVSLRNKPHSNPVITIYNILGKQIYKTDVSGNFPSIQTTWMGVDEDGNNVESGIYFVNVNLGDSLIKTRKVVLIK